MTSRRLLLDLTHNYCLNEQSESTLAFDKADHEARARVGLFRHVYGYWKDRDLLVYGCLSCNWCTLALEVELEQFLPALK